MFVLSIREKAAKENAAGAEETNCFVYIGNQPSFLRNNDKEYALGGNCNNSKKDPQML